MLGQIAVYVYQPPEKNGIEERCRPNPSPSDQEHEDEDRPSTPADGQQNERKDGRAKHNSERREE